jgi:hypothetical protein
MHTTNSLGIDRLKYVEKEMKKMLLIGPFLYSLSILLLFFSMSSKSVAFAYFISGVFSIFYLIFGIYAPNLLVGRQNKTVFEIEFENNKVIVKTFDLLWLKAKMDSIRIEDLDFKNATFPWYGQVAKDGLRLRTKNQEYFLVKDYFDDYQKILDHFTNSTILSTNKTN